MDWDFTWAQQQQVGQLLMASHVVVTINTAVRHLDEAHLLITTVTLCD